LRRVLAALEGIMRAAGSVDGGGVGGGGAGTGGGTGRAERCEL